MYSRGGSSQPIIPEVLGQSLRGENVHLQNRVRDTRHLG